MSEEYLSDRLREIAKDQGIDDPKWAYFEGLLGLSNGRISQIFEPCTITRLGANALIKLNELGYRSEWVNNGTLPKRISETPVNPKKKISIRARKIIARIESAESSGSTPPEILTAIEAVLDIIPHAKPDDYDGLDQAIGN
jgi:hypothetical protein